MNENFLDLSIGSYEKRLENAKADALRCVASNKFDLALGLLADAKAYKEILDELRTQREIADMED
jgi:hypothetical protein